MKYLILLLLPVNLFALTYDIKVKDYKTDVVTHGAKLTGAKAQDWMQKIQKKRNPWGYKKQRFIADLAERPISPEDLNDHANIQCWDRSGAVITYRACTTKQVVVQEYKAAYKTPELDVEGKPRGEMIQVPEQPEITATSYEIPATYKLVITDITAQIAAEETKMVAEQAGIDQAKAAYKVFKKGTATNAQVQKAIAILSKKQFGAQE